MTFYPHALARMRLTGLTCRARARTYLRTKTRAAWLRVEDARRQHREAKLAHGEWLDAAIQAAAVDS